MAPDVQWISRPEISMSFASPLAEQRLRNTSRLVYQGMWLLFLIAAGLMIIVRRSVPARIGSIWILGCAVLAFMLSFALRDAVRKVGHRNTEDRIVKEVKSFLQSQPAPTVAKHAPANRTASPAAGVPSGSAGFVPLKSSAPYRTPAGEPVVFDAFPSRESVAIKMDFYALEPRVLNNY
jgi:hypothetical protein